MAIRNLLARGAVLAILSMAWTAGYALAQDRPSAVDPKACSADERLRVGPGGAPEPRDPKPETPSEKLARTEGILCPPNVDPDIKAPTPDVGITPVIPPPGSPGGDPTVRPK
jgi:hypothetical protein